MPVFKILMKNSARKTFTEIIMTRIRIISRLKIFKTLKDERIRSKPENQGE